MGTPSVHSNTNRSILPVKIWLMQVYVKGNPIFTQWQSNWHLAYKELGLKWTDLHRIMNGMNQIHLHSNIYILGIFTEKPYIKPLERNVIYIPITTFY